MKNTHFNISVYSTDLSHMQIGQMVPCLQFLFRMLAQHSSWQT